MHEILNKTSREYLASLIPTEIPDWKKSWEEGYAIGEGITIPRTPFMEKYGVKNEIEYRLAMAREGKMTWQINTGLSSVEEQVAALKAAEKFNEETGLRISFAHQLPKNIVGTPKDKRENIPTALGFDLDAPEDWLKISMASTIQPIFGDNHLGYPNAVYTTKCCLEAGCRYQGLFGTFHQVAPGCPDEVWNMNENVKALGICAAKYDDQVIVTSNADDSLPAYCMDFASYLAWGKFEKYIVTDLCKARYAFSFGNFTTDIIHKAAMWLAASDTFSKEDQPGVEFIYPNSVDHWDHHLHSNYGFQIPEALMITLVERKFKTGGSFLAIPITEKVTIPTVEEMLDMNGAIQRAVECAEAYEQLIDWKVVEDLRDQIKEFSEKMVKNVLNGLAEAGVDITNPIEMMVIFKKMDPRKFEQFFHPSIVDAGRDHVVPFLPAALWKMSERQIAEILKTVKQTEPAEKVKGKRICVVSGDVHYAGALVISEVLQELGADVIHGGDSMEAIDTLDLADEHGITDICVSLHNGQALNYAKLLLELAEKRNKNYRFFMGGVLTSFLNETDAEPTDVTSNIREMGITTCTTVEDLLEKLAL